MLPPSSEDAAGIYLALNPRTTAKTTQNHSSKVLGGGGGCSQEGTFFGVLGALSPSAEPGWGDGLSAMEKLHPGCNQGENQRQEAAEGGGGVVTARAGVKATNKHLPLF